MHSTLKQYRYTLYSMAKSLSAHHLTVKNVCRPSSNCCHEVGAQLSLPFTGTTGSRPDMSQHDSEPVHKASSGEDMVCQVWSGTTREACTQPWSQPQWIGMLTAHQTSSLNISVWPHQCCCGYLNMNPHSRAPKSGEKPSQKRGG